MKNAIAIVLAWMCSAALFGQYTQDNLSISSSKRAVSPNESIEAAADATPVHNDFDHLRLYPVYANETFTKAHEGVGNYTSLRVAMEGKKVKITEQVGGASVPRLLIENVSQDTIMILAGEMVNGGRQNRVVAQDVIIPPQSGAMDLTVFCVEHGRWSASGEANGKDFESYGQVAAQDVRATAAKKQSQTEVWEKVSEVVTKNGAENSTGAYAGLTKNEEFGKKLESYKAHFGTLPSRANNIIGVVAVSGGKVIGCDLFANHGMFEQAFPDLITAYATEAITNGGPVSIGDDKVQEYLSHFLQDEATQEKRVEENGTLLKNKSTIIHLSTF